MNRPTFRDQLSDQTLDYTIRHRELIADAFWPLARFVVDHAHIDDNTRSVSVTRDVLDTGDVAIIIPYDPKSDSIVVIRQFRIGSALAIDRAAPIELPAGLVDEGETIEAAAIRELREETGLEALAIEHCFSYVSTPGLTTEHANIFLAIVDASDLKTNAGKPDEDEHIRPILAPVEELVRAVDEARVENGFLLCCTHWFARKGRARAQALVGTLTED
ncbi:NUDIX hydrolase [Fulvimarina sp. 2208YS6-2-32]|uniref:ADP-ribose pyrophosphatase n=1 Tax=Fulvimarina uroteuthidis TaxID=3098149 RepID=A0ABU5I3B5_9HYPH|nr:NUDIX hydrolase [Fulvimarina sp. 2208YS6-2-32]MDY8109860.1 NUDIX hydrolase [Fulvimarina sp. 2208YS6-2-32]